MFFRKNYILFYVYIFNDRFSMLMENSFCRTARLRMNQQLTFSLQTDRVVKLCKYLFTNNFTLLSDVTVKL